MRGVYEKVKGSNDWYISYFDAEGRHHRQHVGRHSAAVEAYVSKKREIREGKFIPPAQQRNTTTFEDLFRKRMTDLKRNLSRRTYDHLESNFRHPRFSTLRDMRAQKIHASDIEKVLSAMHDEGLSDGTIRNYRHMISAVFNYGLKHDHVTANPVLKTIAPKRPKHRVRFLSEDEDVSIRNAIRSLFPHREPEFSLLLNTGMRGGEAYGLTWDRVHLDRSQIEIPEDSKTGLRYVPINSACRVAIEQLHRQSNGSEFLLPRGGERENYAMGKWFRKAVQKSGVIHATPHTLRHTFASRLVMAGVNIKRVQEYLGHASIEMTMVYAHLYPEAGQTDVEKLCPKKKPLARAPIADRRAKPILRAASRREIAKIA